MTVNFIDGFRPGWIELEDEVSIAPLVSLVSESHPNDSILYREYGMQRSGKIIIRNGAWLGAGVVVLPGITIGTAAVIGANAVVTTDVDDYAVMAGVPARKIGDVRPDRDPTSAAEEGRPEKTNG
jgi:maltose O-acetyltransferase